MEANKHVLCEKPLSTSVEISKLVVDAAKKKPQLKVICGFTRRFDASYRDAWNKMDSGLIGRASILPRRATSSIRAASSSPTPKFPGGIFVDCSCSIHAIDLALWFDSSAKSAIVKSVVSSGRHHGRASLACASTMIATTRRALSRSTAVGSPICTLRIGHDGCRAGREDSTEIVGAEGKVTVKMQSQTNVVRVYEALGVRREILGTYYARFEQVFVTGANGFMAACLDDGKLPMKLSL